MEGWIKISRKLQKHWVWDDPVKLKAWLSILLTVNHEETKVNIKNKIFVCGRGESLRSLDSWAKEFGPGWNKSSVRRFFEILLTEQMIVLNNEQKTTRLTVCNYETYQDSRNDYETIMKRKRNDCETILTPNKNDKNEKNDKNDKNEKNITPPLSPQGENNPASDFEKKIVEQKKPAEKKTVDLSKFDYPFSSEKFLTVWGEWMKQKKQIRKEFSAHEKNLKRLGEYEEEFAIWLVENAISGDYQGCIFTHTPFDYEKFLKNKQGGGENFNKKMSFTDFQNMPTDGKPAF